MDRETLIRRLEMLGVPYAEGDLEKLLLQYQGCLAAFRQFPDMDPMGDEPALIFHPEVRDVSR